MNEGHSLSLRAVLEKHYVAMSDEAAALYDSQTERGAAAVEHTRQTAARETAETLNQTVRRIRQAESQAAVLQVIAKAASGFAQRAVVVAVESGHARSVGGEDGEAIGFSIDDASAVRETVEGREPVVALPTEQEIGFSLEGLPKGGRAYLFPIAARQKVTAVLITSGGVAPAPLELFCEAAGLKMETLLRETAPAASFGAGSGLVRIASPSMPDAASGGRPAWDELSAEDQTLHLQAQRIARVKVAQMRLAHPDELQRGTFDGDVYRVLQTEIDAARAEFLQTFLAKSATMVDYLHLEIARSLVHDDDRLLGKDYPGPMV